MQLSFCWQQGVIFTVFGVLGLVGGSSMTPYEARQGVVMVRGIIYDTEGNSQWGWGTGWAIGKPGEPVEYIVTNGHVVADAYEYPQQYPNEIFGSVEVYYSAAENDLAQAEIVYYSPPDAKGHCHPQAAFPHRKADSAVPAGVGFGKARGHGLCPGLSGQRGGKPAPSQVRHERCHHDKGHHQQPHHADQHHV